MQKVAEHFHASPLSFAERPIMDAFLAQASEYLTLATAYTVLLWGIRLAALIIVPFRRSPSAAKAWLMLIFFQPIVGLVLYLIFGRAIQPRWLQQRRKRWEQMFKTIITKINTISDKRGYTLKHTPPLHATYIQKQFPLPPASGNHAEWIDDYEGFNEQLIADIASAKHHVHLLFYIYRNDVIGRRVANALADASARGVTCRVLIDAIGSWPRTIRRRLLKSGVHVHSAVPLNRRTTNIFNFVRADLRNHRKIAVIDGLIGYTGSQNITKQDTPHQQELMVRLTGPAVLGLQAIFSADWFLESEEVLDKSTYYPTPPTKPRGTSIAQVLPSGPDYPGTSVDDLVITLIHNARNRIMVATPYFIPSEPLLHAMRSAVKRGGRSPPSHHRPYRFPPRQTGTTVIL